MKKDFVVPREWVRDASPPALRPNGGRGARGAAAAAEVVAQRTLEAGMDVVHAATRLPDGSVRVWGEKGGTRPSSDVRAFNDGWERVFGRPRS